MTDPNLDPPSRNSDADLHRLHEVTVSPHHSPNKAILAAINSTLRNCGLEMNWTKVPASIPGCEGLLSKKLLMIDDQRLTIATYAPQLIAETGGTASAHWHTDLESASSLFSLIVEKAPSVVLLDHNLAGNVKGLEVAQLLLAFAPQIQVIGFSDASVKQEFEAIGAAAVHKSVENFEECLVEVARVVESH